MIEEIDFNLEKSKQQELMYLANESREIKELCADISNLIQEQHVEYHEIDDTLEETYAAILDTSKNLDKTSKLVKKNNLLKAAAVVGLGVMGTVSGGLLGGYILGHALIGGAIGLFGGTGIVSSALLLKNNL